MFSASELAQLSREALISHVLDLQSENHALSRHLCSMKSVNYSGNSSSSGGRPTVGSVPRRRHSTSSYSLHTAAAASGDPVASRMSARRKYYDISMTVLLIENGTARCVPLPALLDKTYSREGFRDADTPVVAGKLLRDTESMPTCRFSAGEFSLSMNLADEFAAADQPARSARLSDRLEECGSRGNSLTQKKLQHQPTNRDDDNTDSDEPSPQDPGEAGAGEGGSKAWCTSVSNSVVARDLAARAGDTCIDPKGDDLRFSNIDFSLDTDAIMSTQTLRYFSQQFDRDNNITSPVSLHGNAIYHYVVHTFAVCNGCQHFPNDVASFGRGLISLCGEVARILAAEPRHSTICSPCYVFGDLHGNFRDLFYFMDNLISFQDLRYTPHRFLFLGDYVDRGDFSVEVVAYLFAMKVLAPHKVLLLRGNHEDSLVSGDISGYGNSSFRAQCHAVFGSSLGEELWHRASDTFANLPLSANIDGKIFCTHGGIPRYRGGTDDRMDLLKSHDFPVLRSFFEVPEKESMQHRMYRQLGMDACWADPAECEDRLDKWGFGTNPRGSGVILFGSKAVDDFLDHSGFELIFRAHQEKSEGLKLSKSARVFTIFSTSAYVGHENGAGVVLVADGKIRLIVKTADSFDNTDENLRTTLTEEHSARRANNASGQGDDH